MSNTSRNIRGILAVAALAAGTGWTMIAPASAGVVPCEGRGTPEALERSETVTSICEKAGGVGGGAITDGTSVITDGTGAVVGRMSAQGDGETPSADRLARIAGLPGLARASSVAGFTDAGGVAAGHGFRTLPSGLPGLSGSGAARMLPGTPAGALGDALPGMPEKAADALSGMSAPAVAAASTARWPGTLAEMPDLPGMPGTTGAPGSPGDGLSWLRLEGPVPPSPDGAAPPPAP
ncbi:hypothetical protein, partial [Streptosporangium fragile]|uniref:hypothetical protein n=1 Tax=Streptosporangium fragile TaxID=46186 RepID=UPI0031EE19D3